MSRRGSADIGATPQRIGRYELRTWLGTGGFAVVYEAYDPALDATAALKLFNAPADYELARERFVTEAQLLRIGLATGLDALHQAGIVHRDIGPTILAGTPSFRAPEQTIRGAEITPATDVYGATGVLWA